MSYASFQNTYKDRTPMVYVGANDTMLHGFNVRTGKEVMAFMPDIFRPQLHDFARPSHSDSYFVDGSPNIVDACVSNLWRSMLVGGLG